MTVRCGVLGDPIAHSLSPVLHRAAHTALGLAGWEYDGHRVPSGGLPDFLAGLDETWRGLSLTMPLKREALPLVDELTDRARLAGAVNTIVIEDGRRFGDNTDLPGAAAAIRERTDRPLNRAVILGGGATATSTGLALCDLGVRTVGVAVRDAGRAAATAGAISAHPSRPEVSVVPLAGDDAWEADVVVSTIPVAAQSAALVARCGAVPVVFEVLYDPWPTPLAAAAEDRVLVSGLDLLVHQAALQVELFTGQPAPLEPMRAAGERALAERSGA